MKTRYDYSRFQATGNKAIDLCANIIGCARENNQAIKALHLQKTYFEWYKAGVKTLINRDLEEGEGLQFDGVNIEQGGRFQSKPVVIEYYPQMHQQA